MNKDKARNIMIGTAVLVTLINISVFNIWIPARLQINDTYAAPTLPFGLRIANPRQLHPHQRNLGSR